MDSAAGGTARAEWRRHWPVALAGCLGYSAMGVQVYAIGPFVVPIEQEFGWSRAAIMAGLTVTSLVGIALNFVVGIAVDRLGPRRVGITGLVLLCTTWALLGTATGTLANWIVLWLLVGFGILLTQSTVWANAVADRFVRGRGLALAVVLSGSSLAAALLPVLAAELIAYGGWRFAFAGIGATWLVLTLPLVLRFFRGTRDRPGRRDVRDPAASSGPAAALTGASVAECLRRRAFWQLLVAAFIFAYYTMAISPNLVPLLESKGAEPLAAAKIAAVVGLVGIAARIAAGYLIDHLPAHLLGAVIFLLPVAGCAVLLGDSPSRPMAVFAVITFGFTIGAEFDVTFYLASRHFGLRSYGAVMGALLTAGSSGAAIAPIVSGRIYDLSRSYDAMLVLLMVLLTLAALSLALLGRPPPTYDAVPH